MQHFNFIYHDDAALLCAPSLIRLVTHLDARCGTLGGGGRGHLLWLLGVSFHSTIGVAAVSAFRARLLVRKPLCGAAAAAAAAFAFVRGRPAAVPSDSPSLHCTIHYRHTAVLCIT